jgi:hypothetical protein
MTMDLNIYIPSKSRWDIQRTFQRMPAEIKAKTKIVVPNEEAARYARIWGEQHILPTSAVGIAPTRDFILEYGITENQKYLVMLDDDVVLQKRRGPVVKGEKAPSITNCTPAEYPEAFAWIEEKLLAGYAHCGWGLRFNGFAAPGEESSPARMMHCLAYDLEVIQATGARFCNGVDPTIHSMDDFNMTLQLLTKGYANVISLVYRASPAPSNARGGASTWRTLETQNASAHRMVELFPDFVTLRAKDNWQGMTGAQMFDITAKWAKALQYGRAVREQ